MCQRWPKIPGIIGVRRGSYMSAHVLLNLLNLLEKRIRCIYLYHNKVCKKKQKKKKHFIKQIAGQLIQDIPI